METKAYSVSLEKNPVIAIRVIPGHFTTSNVHSNNYLDVSDLKSNANVAQDVARELAIPYLSNVHVDTIVCMEKTEVIGAYLAKELTQEGTSVINAGGMIHVVSPIINAYGNLIFQGSMIEWINGKNILLLIASISSGRTLNCALECLAYYGGIVVGKSALFVASQEMRESDVNTLFTADDIPGYEIFKTADCEMCKAGRKLDAIITSEGYTIIE